MNPTKVKHLETKEANGETCGACGERIRGKGIVRIVCAPMVGCRPTEYYCLGCAQAD